MRWERKRIRVDIAKQAVEQAKLDGRDLVIIDTAGRLHVDEVLMTELKNIKAAVNPTENQLPSVLQTGREAGMQTPDDEICRLVETGVINPEDAISQAQNNERSRSASTGLPEARSEHDPPAVRRPHGTGAGAAPGRGRRDHHHGQGHPGRGAGRV